MMMTWAISSTMTFTYFTLTITQVGWYDIRAHWLPLRHHPPPLVAAIVVTTGIEPSSNIGNALVSAMYGRSSELGLYLWGNPPLPTVQGLPPPVGGG